VQPSQPVREILGLAPLDLLGLGIVVILLVIGLATGLWWQVIRLLGLLASVALARLLAPPIAAMASERWPELGSRLGHGIAWVTVFVAALGAAALLGRLGQRFLETLQLDLPNRLGGGLVGALTGVLLYVAMLVTLVQLAPEAFVGRAFAGSVSERVVDAVGTRFPLIVDARAADELHHLFERMRAQRALVHDPRASDPAQDDRSSDSSVIVPPPVAR
jgi:uncharacterized membrane protein required for colicin V production